MALTIADVLKNVVETKTTEPEVKAYRTRTGRYIGEFGKTWRRIDAKGRESMSILVKLHNDEMRFRGTTFVKISWQLVKNAKGVLDRQSKLFYDIVESLGAPETAEVDQVLGAIEGEHLRVDGMEYFNVALEHVDDEKQREYAKRFGYTTTRVYIKGEEDELRAKRLVKLGYKSEFDVTGILPLD